MLCDSSLRPTSCAPQPPAILRASDDRAKRGNPRNYLGQRRVVAVLVGLSWIVAIECLLSYLLVSGGEPGQRERFLLGAVALLLGSALLLGWLARKTARPGRRALAVNGVPAVRAKV